MGITYIPVSNWTMEAEGNRRVAVTGIEERQITTVLSVTMSGNYLPPQLIYQGTNNRCLPKMIAFLSDWNVTCTQYHRATEDKLQLLDANVNRSAKEFLRGQFHQWYASQVSSQIEKGKGPWLVNLSLTIIKPLSATWMIKLYDYLLQHLEIVKMGFKK